MEAMASSTVIPEFSPLGKDAMSLGPQPGSNQKGPVRALFQALPPVTVRASWRCSRQVLCPACPSHGRTLKTSSQSFHFLHTAPTGLPYDPNLQEGDEDFMEIQKNKNRRSDLRSNGLLLGDPTGNRTRVTAVKGRCLDRLTMGPKRNPAASYFPGQLPTEYHRRRGA